MALPDEPYTQSHPSHPDFDETVAVVPAVPIDRVRWGAILAGTFAALTALAILATLGIAIGLSTYDQGQDNPRHFALGYGIWGIISTILAFAFGGFLTARVAALRSPHNGLLNGMMVAAFGLPLLMFLVGSAGALVGHAEVANGDVHSRVNADRNDTSSAIPASARVPADSNVSNATVGQAKPSAEEIEQARRAASRTAWGTLFTMVLALGAASFGGYTGSNARDADHDVRRRGERATRTP
jgi:hypothetical protein